MNIRGNDLFCYFLCYIFAPGLESEFNTQSQNNFGYSYDKKSIMQYGKTAFGKTLSDGTTAVTMQSNSDANEKLGAVSHMDANDLGKINSFYQCSSPETCKLLVNITFMRYLAYNETPVINTRLVQLHKSF